VTVALHEAAALVTERDRPGPARTDHHGIDRFAGARRDAAQVVVAIVEVSRKARGQAVDDQARQADAMHP
jgi:hypothetical protein